MRFCTITLGCKANQYDTGTIESMLLRRGHELKNPGSGCDVCIINTCAVTAESVRKSRQAVRRAKKLEPDALIAVCGCYSNLEHEAVTSLGASVIGNTSDAENFADCIEEKLNSQLIPNSDGSQSETLLLTPNSSFLTPNSPRTRALLKIQDGCDNCCTYCIVPYARGCSRSVPLDEIAQKARSFKEQGYKEIVITGIEISDYRDCSSDLIDVLKTISKTVPDARLRLGSLNPDVLSPDFIGRLSEIPKLCNHFHISLQSGCESTLARMGRRYKTNTALKAVTELRNIFDNCGITADLIAGFPGETDTEFEQTLRFIEKAKFSAMHIFPYSKRPGTAAADMPDQILQSEKKVRTKTAAQTAAKMSAQFRQAQIGRTLEVLFETCKGGSSFGHSSNYLTVAVSGAIPKNTMADVKITEEKNSILYGEII